MLLSLGSDHGGFELRKELLVLLQNEGHELIVRGNDDGSPVDYPDIAYQVSADVLEKRSELGILICGTGIGMSNAASRVDGITAALCCNSYMARMARLHNDANILCLGGRVLGTELAWDIVTEFIANTPLMDEKYIIRRKKVKAIR